MGATDEPWQDLGGRRGVRVRALGAGRDLVVVPGMEGDGTSCLHGVLPVWRALDQQTSTRLLLLDYAAEDHPSQDALLQTMIEVLRQSGIERPYAVWGQSFGCLLAAELAHRLRAERAVLVSPFTTLPRSRRIGARVSAPIPRPLYRLTNPPVSNWLFGPIIGPAGTAFQASLSATDPAVVARRTSWLDEARNREVFARLLRSDVRASTWFGSRDRLVHLAEQVDTFTELTPGAELPRLIPGSGHVVFPSASVTFLVDRTTTWLSSGPGRHEDARQL